ncbi:MAG TPA: sulfate reduction electron transfer complex DsrMKJOP subunit DsrM [Chloroflexota bacterium]|nr:sulfate reduction electron transfer complex DsrMKJOP subunit DsrM [Chloroflexota bacterium]
MKALYPLLVVLLLVVAGYVGGMVDGLRPVFGVVLPYLAFLLFAGGFCYRVLIWARSPVPYHIPTTCGQARSLPWIKASNLESPHTSAGVIGRMLLEVLFFRSLFRNSTFRIEKQRILYWGEQLLWVGALLFHWSLLVIVLRHVRFFTEPVPGFVYLLQGLDGFFRVGEPVVYVTTAGLLVAASYLLYRRFALPKIRYISLVNDYFPLYLILAIGLSGILMRHFFRTDVVAVKELAMGLVSFSPAVPTTISPLFFVHLLLVSSLFAYFPFSKLMHMGGIFLSPTRNLANNGRMRRHVNPWDYPVPVHTHGEWQEEFKDKLEAADIPLDSEDTARPVMPV